MTAGAAAEAASAVMAHPATGDPPRGEISLVISVAVLDMHGAEFYG